MKRHESILVYGVTGLLLLILFVAVVFGNEGDATVNATAKAEEVGDPALELAELMNLDPVAPLRDAEEAAEGEGQGEPAETEEPLEGQVDPVPEGDAESTAGTEGTPAELAAEEVAAETAAVAPPRFGDYREVTVKRGDTFSLIVQRWCGSLDQMPVVEALNEDVERDSLRPGRKLLVPWSTSKSF